MISCTKDNDCKVMTASAYIIGRDKPMAAVESALARKLNRFLPLGREELAALAQLEARHRPVAAGTELIHEREAGQRAFILQEGWACCYKLLPDGGRQVIDFRLPGDFIGLRSVLLRTADHSSAAVTDVVVAEVPAQRMLASFQELPRLGAAILWAASRDEAMVVEHLVGIGRRSALVRTAHLLVELGLAPAAGGPGRRGRLRLPLEPVRAGRRAGADRDPRQPRPAPAARAQALDLPRRPGGVPRPAAAAPARRPPRRLPRPGPAPPG